MLSRKDGQSTLEYIIILSAIVGLLIWFAATKLPAKISSAFTDVQKSMDNSATKIAPK